MKSRKRLTALFGISLIACSTIVPADPLDHDEGAADDSRDGGGTTSGMKEVERRRATPRMAEVEQRREQLPEQPPRATSGTVAERASHPPAGRETPSYLRAEDILRHGRPEQLALRSRVALVRDDREGVVLYGRHIDEPRPIASLTKLMTALVILESSLPLGELIAIASEDRDTHKGTHARLNFGAVLTRHDLLQAALGASDNRAAAALARTYPGGREAMVRAMNEKARQLGMSQTRFADSTGLDSGDVSTARDLAQLVAATRAHTLIRLLSTAGEFTLIDRATGEPIAFYNTNRLVRTDGAWDIHLSKTGYTAAAGRCLVMQITVGGRPLTIVLLNSWGRLSKYGDANRIRDWLLKAERRIPRLAAAPATGG